MNHLGKKCYKILVQKSQESSSSKELLLILITTGFTRLLIGSLASSMSPSRIHNND